MNFLKITLLAMLLSLPASAEIVPGGVGAPASFPSGLTGSINGLGFVWMQVRADCFAGTCASMTSGGDNPVISVVRVGTGTYTATFTQDWAANDQFSCTVNNFRGDSKSCSSSSSSTINTWEIQCFDISVGSLIDSRFNMTCIGELP